MATTPNYAVDFEDPRFKAVEQEKQAKVESTTNTYNEMINNSDSHYQQMIDSSKEWANTQQDLQNQQTDFAIEKINQQKAEAEKTYLKEQKGAYIDFTKEVNAYGANAEQMAANGLQNSGYSESSRVSLYNTYQNRYATAKDSYNRAVLNYDNSIKEAQLANNSALAEISYKALQSQLELSLQGFQYKNNLLLQQADAINKVEDTYYNRYQNVLAQINQENSMAEQVRQYNEKMAEERRQYNETMAFQKDQAKQQQSNWEKQYALSKSSSSSKSSSGGSTKKTTTKKATLTDNTKKAQITDNNKTETTNTKKQNSALTMFVENAPTPVGKTYGTAAKAAIAKGYSAVRVPGLLKDGIIKQKTVNGKTYYY